MVRLRDCVDEAGKDGEQKSSQVGEDLTDVVTAAAEDGVECVTDRALEDASGKASVSEPSAAFCGTLSGPRVLATRR